MKTFILTSLLLLTGCNKSYDIRGQNAYLIRYNISGIPEISTTDKIYWGSNNLIMFVDQNGIKRTVSGTFEIIHLTEI